MTSLGNTIRRKTPDLDPVTIREPPIVLRYGTMPVNTYIKVHGPRCDVILLYNALDNAGKEAAQKHANTLPGKRSRWEDVMPGACITATSESDERSEFQRILDAGSMR